jgi:integrase
MRPASGPARRRRIGRVKRPRPGGTWRDSRRASRLPIAAADGAGIQPGEPLTLARYATKWIADRRPLGLATISDDEARLRRHVLPTLGQVLLEAVRPRHVRELVLKLRADGKAPRTIHHAFHTLALMFKTAMADELLDTNPCILPKGTLPKKVDKDPAWRATAIYTREEIAAHLRLAHPRKRTDPVRRKALGGLRHGEAAGLTWRQYDATLEPMGGLSLERTRHRFLAASPFTTPSLARWPNGSWRAGNEPLATSRPQQT